MIWLLRVNAPRYSKHVSHTSCVNSSHIMLRVIGLGLGLGLWLGLMPTFILSAKCKCCVRGIFSCCNVFLYSHVTCSLRVLCFSLCIFLAWQIIVTRFASSNVFSLAILNWIESVNLLCSHCLLCVCLSGFFTAHQRNMETSTSWTQK